MYIISYSYLCISKTTKTTLKHTKTMVTSIIIIAVILYAVSVMVSENVFYTSDKHAYTKIQSWTVRVLLYVPVFNIGYLAMNLR